MVLDFCIEQTGLLSDYPVAKEQVDGDASPDRCPSCTYVRVWVRAYDAPGDLSLFASVLPNPSVFARE